MLIKIDYSYFSISTPICPPCPDFEILFSILQFFRCDTAAIYYLTLVNSTFDSVGSRFWFLCKFNCFENQIKCRPLLLECAFRLENVQIRTLYVVIASLLLELMK